MDIKPSELILNPDGSVYHLHLHPEQVSSLILTVGDPDRVAQVSKYFDQVEYKVQKREFITHTGRVGKNRITVISTGIGPDNIDIVLNELDALFNIDLNSRQVKPETKSLTFVRIGTAGGLQEEIPVDAIVASTGALGMDGLLQYYDAPEFLNLPLLNALKDHCHPHWSFPLQPYFVESDPNLLSHFQRHCFSGITATNPGFYGPQGRQLRARVKAPEYLDYLQSFEFDERRIVNLEMETSAMYGLSSMLGHRALSLSTILANRALGQFSKNPATSVQKLIEFTLEHLEYLPK